MTTRTKITISSYTTSIMMILMIFYKQIGIPEPYQWILVIPTLISITLMIYLQKTLKKEMSTEPNQVTILSDSSAEFAVKKKKKKQILLMIVIGTITGLTCPLWLPLTGRTSLGATGDLMVGVITTAIIVGILGPKLRKL